MTTTIEKLYEALDLKSEAEYYTYFYDAHINKNFDQLRKMLVDITEVWTKEDLVDYVKGMEWGWEVVEWIAKNS